MVFAPVQNSRRADGRVILKKARDGMEKQTKVGRENEDTRVLTKTVSGFL